MTMLVRIVVLLSFLLSSEHLLVHGEEQRVRKVSHDERDRVEVQRLASVETSFGAKDGPMPPYNNREDHENNSDNVSFDRDLVSKMVGTAAGKKSCRCNADRNPKSKVRCRIAMSDSLNGIESVLKLRGDKPQARCLTNKYRIFVYDNQSSSRQWRQKMRVKPSTQLEFRGAGVPQVDCAKLVDFYALRDDESLTFRELESCTDFEKAAIYFLINEWFYFG